MQGAELVGAGVVLVATIAVGLIAHELTHALVLQTLRVPHKVRWFPGEQESTLTCGLTGTWASVTPERFPNHMPTWGLRLSATAPLALAVPLFLFVSGVGGVPQVGTPYFTATVVGWLACSIPSPQDFSVFWHAERVIETHRGSASPRQ